MFTYMCMLSQVVTRDFVLVKFTKIKDALNQSLKDLEEMVPRDLSREVCESKMTVSKFMHIMYYIEVRNLELCFDSLELVYFR